MGFNSAFKGLNKVLVAFEIEIDAFFILSDKITSAMDINTRIPVKIVLDSYNKKKETVVIMIFTKLLAIFLNLLHKCLGSSEGTLRVPETKRIYAG